MFAGGGSTHYNIGWNMINNLPFLDEKEGVTLKLIRAHSRQFSLTEVR